MAAALEAVDAADACVFDAQHAVLVHAVQQAEAVLNLVGVYVFARLVDDDILAAALHVHAHALFQAHDVPGLVPAFGVQVGPDELAVLQAAGVYGFAADVHLARVGALAV